MKRALLLILLVALAFGQITEPKLVSHLESEVTQSGSIYAQNGDIFSLDINMTIPQQTTYQTVEIDTSFVLDADNNQLAHISDSDPSNPFSYRLDSTVVTNERVTTFLPDSYTVPDNFLIYVQPSASVQSDDATIREFAEWITANSSSDFEKIVRLTDWVNGYVDYDLSFVGQRKDAIWILENKKGVCVEYSALFAALARSLGYPTRFVLGQAYGDYGWLGHAWNEVYIGEWVPVDATWLEAGHLDATHIEFFRGSESEASNRVIAKVSNQASIHWEKPEFAGESGGTTVDIVSIDSTLESEAYSLSSVASTLGYGEQTLVTFSMEGNDYRLLDLRLVPCRAEEEIVSITQPSKTVILEPGKTTHTSWILTTSSNLDPDVRYTCPVTLNSRYLKELSLPLTVERSSKITGFSTFISDSSVNLGEAVSIFVRATAGEKFTLSSDDYFESRFASSGTTEFTFVPQRAGTHEVLIASENGGVAALFFRVTKTPEVYVKKVEIPSPIFIDEESEFTVLIENSLDSSELVSVRVSIDGVEHLSHLSVSGLTAFNFTLVPQGSDEQVLNIEITGEGISDQKSIPLFVYEQPELVIGEPSFEEYNDLVFVSIPIYESNSVENTIVSFAGQRQTLNASKAKFLVRPGVYQLSLQWSDTRGDEYTETILINTVASDSSLTIWERYAFVWATLIALALFWGFYSLSRTVKKMRS